MTDIENKALALVNEVRLERGLPSFEIFDRTFYSEEALCRAIEQHEAFKLEVSNAVEKLLSWPSIRSQGIVVDNLARFIIAKRDPLVEAWLEAFPGNHIEDARDECAKISAALAARGLKIVEVGHD